MQKHLSLSAHMILLDMGNTLSKCAVLNKAGQYTWVGRLESHSTLEKWVAFFQTHGLTHAGHLFAVCVAGEQVQHTLRQALPNTSTLFIKGDTVIEGFCNDYATPHTLGADRYLSAYGASCMQTTPHAFVIATFGTATTVDVVHYQDLAYVYKGGIIYPGLNLMLSSLSVSTAQLPHPKPGAAISQSIPNSTEQALLNGAYLAQAATVERFYNQLQRSTQHPTNLPMQLYICGGNATHLSSWLSIQHQVLEQPALLGLANYAKQHLYTAKP